MGGEVDEATGKGRAVRETAAGGSVLLFLAHREHSTRTHHDPFTDMVHYSLPNGITVSASVCSLNVSSIPDAGWRVVAAAAQTPSTVCAPRRSLFFFCLLVLAFVVRGSPFGCLTVDRNQQQWDHDHGASNYKVSPASISPTSINTPTTTSSRCESYLYNPRFNAPFPIPISSGKLPRAYG